MGRYVVFKKTRRKDGGIKRTHFLQDSSSNVNKLIKEHRSAGNFTRGNFVVFKLKKDGKLSKEGKPFTI